MGRGRGQSESIGVILLTAVVVLGVAGVGVVVLDNGTSDREQILLTVDHEISIDTLTLTHAGGDTVRATDLRVVVRGDGSEQSFVVDAANVSGGDGRLEASERISREIESVSGAVELLVVHDPTNTVLVQVSEQISESVSDSVLTWSSASDWDGAASATGVVHDDVGDRSAGTVELGYPARDRGGSGLLTYWTFDGDATDASSNGHDGTISGARVVETGIAGSRSLAFDGKEDFVEDQDGESYLNGNDAITLSVWVRSNVTGTNRGFIMGQDPDGDGTFEETSDTITLDGSSDYDVTSLSSASRRFRLEVELSTTDPTATPTVHRLGLTR